MPWLLLLHAVLLQLAAYVVRPTAAYRALELGVDVAFLGLIAASFAVLPLVVSVLVGRMADSGRETLILIAGAGLMVGAGIGLLLWSDSLVLLLIWNVVLGLGHLMSVLGEQSRVAQADDGKLDSAFGIYTFAGSIGQALGPLLIVVFGSGRLIPETDMLFGAYLAAALLMLAVTLVLSANPRRGRAAAVEPAVRQIPLREALRVPAPVRRQLFGAMAVSMMVLGAVDLIAVYLPALGVERGLSADLIGLLLTVRAVATMASRLGLGFLVAMFGRQQLIIASMGASAVALAVLTVPMEVWLMGVVLLVAGFALGIGQPLTMTIITLAAPLGTRSMWLALRLSANRAGQSVLPACVGLVAAASGPAGVFGTTAVGLAATALACWRALRP
ncbi:MAG: MFS transporter [Arthrobacter sp.]